MITDYLQEFLNSLGEFETILQLSTLFLVYFGSDQFTIKAVNWTKDKLGWSGKQSELLVVIFSVLGAISIQVTQGILTPELLTFENFAALAVTIGVAAEKRYKKLKETEAELSQAANKLREKLAGLQHEIWLSWHTYLFSVSVTNEDGTVTIPAGFVTKWQMETPYDQLTEEEKDSIRVQADKILNALSEK